MTVLTLCRDGSITVGESILESIADAIGDNLRPAITPPMVAMREVRREKISRIREEIDNGTYGLDERLDAVLERILMDIEP
jgi:hypothetical protein